MNPKPSAAVTCFEIVTSTFSFPDFRQHVGRRVAHHRVRRVDYRFRLERRFRGLLC